MIQLQRIIEDRAKDRDVLYIFSHFGEDVEIADIDDVSDTGNANLMVMIYGRDRKTGDLFREYCALKDKSS